jgi:hypothetical protein
LTTILPATITVPTDRLESPKARCPTDVVADQGRRRLVVPKDQVRGSADLDRAEDAGAVGEGVAPAGSGAAA